MVVYHAVINLLYNRLHPQVVDVAVIFLIFKAAISYFFSFVEMENEMLEGWNADRGRSLSC